MQSETETAYDRIRATLRAYEEALGKIAGLKSSNMVEPAAIGWNECVYEIQRALRSLSDAVARGREIGEALKGTEAAYMRGFADGTKGVSNAIAAMQSEQKGRE